jgi:hypothetical protein
MSGAQWKPESLANRDRERRRKAGRLDANDITSLGLLIEMIGFCMLCAEWAASQRCELQEWMAIDKRLSEKIQRLRPKMDADRRELWLGEISPESRKNEFEEKLSDLELERDLLKWRAKSIRKRMRFFEIGCLAAVAGNALQYYAVEFMS